MGLDKEGESLMQRTIASIKESEWSPQWAAFQVWPKKNPMVARHSLDGLDPKDLAKIERICEEVYRAYRLEPIGNDGWYAYFR